MLNFLIPKICTRGNKGGIKVNATIKTRRRAGIMEYLRIPKWEVIIKVIKLR